MKSFLIFAMAVSFALNVHAQVRSTLIADAPGGGLKAGGPRSAKLTVAIAPGWHIASLTQADGGPVRTEISLPKNQPFTVGGKIGFPEPHKAHSAALGMDVETYTGTVVFTLPLVATEDIKPGTKLTIEITYQACNEETCLLPKTDKVSCLIGETKPAADIADPKFHEQTQ